MAYKNECTAPDSELLAHPDTASTSTAQRPTLTYAALIEEATRKVSRSVAGTASETATPTPLRAPQRNVRTAIRRFMQANSKLDAAPVGDELFERFVLCLEVYSKWEREQGTADSTLRSRRSLLRAVHHIARSMDDSVPSTFAGALAWALTRDPRSLKAVALACSIGECSLGQWRRGEAMPSRRREQVAVLEQTLKLPEGFLLDRLPSRAVRAERYGQELAQRPTKFQARQQRIAAEDRYTVAEFPASFREEWRQLLAHKSAALPRLRRAVQGLWRAKDARHSKPLRPEWCCYLDDGRVVTSAHVTFIHVRQYLSWLCLPKSRGGLGMADAQALTLAHLSNAEQVEAFVFWRAERSGGQVNTGALTLLHAFASLLHPETGWVTQSSWLGARLTPSVDETSWKRRCSDAFRSMRDLAARIEPTAKPTRNVEEALMGVLDAQDPLVPLFAMLDAMQADMPAVSQPSMRAIQQRDIALVAVLLSVPARIGLVSALEYGSQSQAHLRRYDRGWRISCGPDMLKNGTTTMSQGLSVDLPDWATGPLDAYAREGRLFLLDGARSPYFFVGRAPWDPNTVCGNLEVRLQVLTARYIPGCPGFRAHGWRHAVAHAWLREHPEDYVTVAALLGDSLETTLRTYGHLKHGDAVRRYRDWAEPKRVKR